MMMPESTMQPSVPETTGARFEVVALVTSAGGLEALSTVLSALPPDLPAAVLVAQHLSGQGSSLAGILRRRITLPVTWIEDGARLQSGYVQICPSGKRLEMLPDGTSSLSPGDRAARDKPLDFFLESLADSFGERVLVVVLTGMGKDSAAGVRAVKRAGGTVIAQSEDTAEQPSMPRAAIDAGADLVLPLHEIGRVAADIVKGGPLPRSQEELDAIRATFGDAGKVAALAREIDWARTSLGAVHNWSPLLRSTARLAMDSPHPVAIYWGDQLIDLVNDAALPAVGGRLKQVLGQPFVDAWPQLRGETVSLVRRAKRGERVHELAALQPFMRDGQLYDGWFDLSFTPIREAGGTVAGVQQVWQERTQEVLAARRLETLNALTGAPSGNSRREALERTLAMLKSAADVPFAAAYLLDASGKLASLVGAVGVEEGGAMAPRDLRVSPGAAWPLHQTVEQQSPVWVDDLGGRFRGYLVGSEKFAPETAVLYPLRDEAGNKIVGVLVLGVHPRAPLDNHYREFLALAADSIESRMAESLVRQRESERLERLAELDRAKTEFFSNVSHEFRTPLTLMLAPLEELRRRGDELPPVLAEDFDVAVRNARRLLGFVNTLLDFSQIEAGRLHTHFAR